jgi:cyclic beta-1,2-glucan synthetase
VEALARHSKSTEVEVARQAVEAAGEVSRDKGDLHHQLAYHLLAEGRESLERQLNCRLPLPARAHRWIEKRAIPIFLGSIALLTAFFVMGALFLSGNGSGSYSWLQLLAACLAIFPASELAVQIIQTLTAWTFGPRVLPKLSFRNGIPDDCRTLVAVPMMLLFDSVREEVEKLEVRYLSNPDANLCLALLSDFTDAAAAQMPEDLDLLDVAVRGIERLNEKHRETRFFLFHRARRFCQTEQ